MTKKKEIDAKLLTEVELELMTILWKSGEGSVAEVIQKLTPDRDLAYTSVSTILRILEQKGVLQIRKEGRGHIYIPLMKKTDYETRAVKDVMERVFAGTPSALVKQLLNTVKMSAKELDEIKTIIDKAGAKK